MAHTLQVLYRQPDDPDEFRRYYRDHHLPLARAIPGVLCVRYTLDVTSLAGEASYFAVFEADFADLTSLQSALASPEGQRAQADVVHFASGGVDILHFSQTC
ncbi:ethyl tert-butyl ether degradation protein EthD [Mycobacterium sp. MS1601]|uniref:EthD family reductase n=1 Tax=Mycobacterium sp. MS1601 TaxID=1936029 RepID=UPI0009794D14|nr:EthD family reductase [Mycobacterium sp. MS1601]AQA01141.1 ethyl tert-butyl ether degradation protein EthD [Mycobacterium sp. MS1601]